MFRFIGRDSWSTRFEIPTWFKEPKQIEEDKDVTVLRGILFFYESQKTKLSRIQLHFTPLAIEKFVHDGFIKIHD